jgi:TonB-dependent receptor
VLVAGAYTKLRTTQNQVSNWGWEGSYVADCQYTSTCTSAELSNTDTSKPIWYTQDLSYDYQQISEERKNARVALQYQPADNLQITVDANYSRDDLEEWQWAFAIWNNVSEMRNIKTSSNGTIVDFTRTAPTDFDANYNVSVQQTYDYGLNAKWDVNNKLTVTLDVDQAMSAQNPGGQASSSADVGYGASTSGGTNSTTFRIVQPGGHQLPYYENYGPNGDESSFLDTSIIGSHVMTSSSQQNRNLVNQMKLEGAWTEDKVTIKAGTQVVLEHFKENAFNDYTNNQWQVYAGYGPDSNNYYSSSGLAAGVHIPSSYFTSTIKTSAPSGWSTVSQFPGLLKFSQSDIWSYLEGLGDPTSETIDGYNHSGVSGYTGKITRAQDPNSFQHVYEDTYAGYLTASTESQVAGMPLKINAGVRYEYTNLTSSGLGRTLKSMTILESDHTAYDFQYNDQTEIKKKNTYQYLLPNIDLALKVSDNFQLRFDASRTLTRPPLSNMNPITSYGGRTGALTASSGNADLLPYLSDNLDVSGEWYYAENSYVSANAYLKSVSNFVITGSQKLTLSDVIDPYTGTAAVFTESLPTNGRDANVYGLEIAWQHMFDDTGFGFQLNGTIVGTDSPYNPWDLTTSNFAVTGLADSANLVTFYDKNGFEIRLAANWRDSYLDHFGQSQNNSSFGTEPTFVNASWSLDGSTSYDFSEHLNVYLEAQNITNESYSTRGRFADQILDVVSIGRRFTVGVHYKL